MHTQEVKHIYSGIRFAVEQITFLSDDDPDRAIIRDVIRHPGAVVVLPVLSDDKIVMIRSYRPAVSEYLWELCAGTLEVDELPEKCAGRELIEETGYAAKSLRLLARFYTSPGITDELIHAYIAEDLTFIGQQLEADECITTRIMPITEALEMIRNGELIDAKSILTILYYYVNQQESFSTP